MRKVLFLSVACLIAPVASAELPEPLKSAVAQSDVAPDFLFDIERTSIQSNDDGEEETVKAYARIDLQAEEFKQITPLHLVVPNSPGSSFEALAGVERAIEDGIWCSQFGQNLPDADDIEVVAEDADTVTYAFTPDPGEDADGPEKKIQKNSEVRLTVSRNDPAILRYERALQKTVTLYVVAKIRKADSTAVCARAPNGQTYISETTSIFEGGGVANGGDNTDMRITNIYDRATGDAL